MKNPLRGLAWLFLGQAALLAREPPRWGLDPTPPMGWNGCQTHGSSGTGEDLPANATCVKEKRRPPGCQYVVIGYRWPDATAANHNPNRFPSSADGKGFKLLADKVHAMGLDCVKADDLSVPYDNKARAEVIRRAIDRSGKPMVFSTPPRMPGMNLPDNDEWTFSLIAIKEMPAINQDPSGQPAKRFARNGKATIWLRDLSDGDKAVALFNRGDADAVIPLAPFVQTLQGAWTARNALQRNGKGELSGLKELTVPEHGSFLLEVAPSPRMFCQGLDFRFQMFLAG